MTEGEAYRIFLSENIEPRSHRCVVYTAQRLKDSGVEEIQMGSGLGKRRYMTGDIKLLSIDPNTQRTTLCWCDQEGNPHHERFPRNSITLKLKVT